MKAIVSTFKIIFSMLLFFCHIANPDSQHQTIEIRHKDLCQVKAQKHLTFTHM